jgi:xanthine/CO dehydrogenase XdhC/CoxF family maturation factor
MMRERRQILDLYHRGEAIALVTLVRVEGSSYRKPGARLLIAADGEYAGAISGGCLEAELLRKTQWKVREGAVVERYSTLFDDTADIPYGLGCGGTVDLLLEPAGTPEFTALMEAMEASLHGETRRVVTELPEHDGPLVRCILDDAGRRISGSKQATVDLQRQCFDEWLASPQRLVVFGAGDDARPLVSMAAVLGWRVIVADGRAQWAQQARFPEAEQVLTGAEMNALAIKGDDAVVVMTHSYEQDRAFLVAALPQRPRYLGLLGARHRSALLLSEAAAMLGWSVTQACEHVFAPLGLDLGGDGAEAVALSAIAEIQACIEGKLPAARRMTASVVEQQIAQGGASRYLQTQCVL